MIYCNYKSSPKGRVKCFVTILLLWESRYEKTR